MSKKIIKLTEDELQKIIKESVNNILKESIFDDDYEEIVPLHDIFKNGFTFNEYWRENLLLDDSLCLIKDGRELNICLNDLGLKYNPNKRR